MQTKLTLRLDEELIERAKRYGKRNGRSVSQMVADYFALLEEELEDEGAGTPLVGSLRGALKEVELDESDVQRERLERHL